MTTFDLESGELAPIALALDRRVTLGAQTLEAPAEQTDRVSLGRPVCLPLDLTKLDPDAQEFLDGRSGSTFHLLALTCGFRADDRAPMEKAWIEVQLGVLPIATAGNATAWSMEPSSLGTSMTVSKSVTLSASLKLTSPLVPVELGPGVERTSGTETESSIPYLEAYREGTSRPSWIFNATEAVAIRGTHRLRAVIELPKGMTGQAQVGIGATMKLKRLGLISYRATPEDLPGQELITFG